MPSGSRHGSWGKVPCHSPTPTTRCCPASPPPSSAPETTSQSWPPGPTMRQLSWVRYWRASWRLLAVTRLAGRWHGRQSCSEGCPRRRQRRSDPSWHVPWTSASCQRPAANGAGPWNCRPRPPAHVTPTIRPRTTPGSRKTTTIAGGKASSASSRTRTAPRRSPRPCSSRSRTSMTHSRGARPRPKREHSPGCPSCSRSSAVRAATSYGRSGMDSGEPTMTQRCSSLSPAGCRRPETRRPPRKPPARPSRRLVRPGKSGGRYVCEPPLILPEASALQ
jgi:hypothetical protein